MKPSFFSLFKRGKYYHKNSVLPATKDDESGEEYERECKELERFVVASVAFCLQHHLAFREHFFEKICRFAGDPALENWSLEIEPHAWSDLSFYNRTSAGTYLYVVECKAGAFLQDHQNPGEWAFATQGGYGRFLEKSEPQDVSLRYTVLGYAIPLNCVLSTSKLRLKAQQRSWNQVVGGFSPDEIALDLFNSLAHLGIAEFAYRQTNTMKIQQSLADAARSGQILTHAADQLGFLEDYRIIESWWESPSEWCFGMIIRPLPPVQGKSSNQRQLMKLVGGMPDQLCWFGYEPHGTDSVRLSVWLYCSSPPLAQAVEAKLKSRFPQVQITSDDENKVQNVLVTTTDETGDGDRGWFISVFAELGIHAV